jgi:hypothetical protein
MRNINKKITLLKEMEFSSNFLFLSETLLELKKKNKNKVVQEMIDALSEIYKYVFELERNKTYMIKAIQDYREQKNKAVLRAREAEIKIEEIVGDE